MPQDWVSGAILRRNHDTFGYRWYPRTSIHGGMVVAVPRRVMLVDDEVHVRDVLQLKLRAAGYVTATACDGAEGLGCAAEFQPHLIVSDYQMPRLNGLEMCRRLATDSILHDVPILLLTSREFEIGPAQTTGTNIRAVRDKPFSPKAIVKLVGELLASAA